MLVQLMLDELLPLVHRPAAGLFLFQIATSFPSTSELGPQALESPLVVEVSTSRLGGVGLGLGPGRSAVRAPRTHLGA